jgi:hypothetical protein
METKTIYMYLPDEAVDVWRPIQAEVLGECHFRILGPVPTDEVWEFQPGTIVRAEIKSLSEGDAWVATSNATN